MLLEVEWPLIGLFFAAANSIVAVKAAPALLAILQLASQHLEHFQVSAKVLFLRFFGPTCFDHLLKGFNRAEARL